ncbi:MAG: glycogen/starch synthase [Planctomycetota bacterium]
MGSVHRPIRRPCLSGIESRICHTRVLFAIRKTNLADIAESLPRAMARQRPGDGVFALHPGHRRQTLVPALRLGSLEVPLGDCSHVPVTYRRGQLGDLSVVLVDHPTAFENKHPYGDENGPYLDNWWRYALFSRAVLEGFALADFTPDVIHCLDWTTGLVPVFHRLHCLGVESHPAHRAGTWFGVHNRAMQGSFEREILPKIGIPHEYFRAIEGVEQGGKVNYLKAGAEFATILGTHLPHQLVDLVAHRRSDGMDETLERRKKEVVGIQNGVDYRHWDPKTDPVLAKNFGPEDQELVGKKKCKAYAQEHYNLDVNPKVPTVFVIERFDSDNGFELLNAALTPLLERGLQLVLMGPGQPEIIDRLRMVEQTFLDRAIEGYNARGSPAGSDAFLMPAHDYSTHTLAAIAMRYGCAPIGYAHNGLEDTLIDMGANPKTGNGYTFPHYSAESLMKPSTECARTSRPPQPGRAW